MKWVNNYLTDTAYYYDDFVSRNQLKNRLNNLKPSLKLVAERKPIKKKPVGKSLK